MLTGGPIIRPTNVPSDDQKAALAGTSGTPGASNPFVTAEDPRYLGFARRLRVDPDGTHGYSSIGAAVTAAAGMSPNYTAPVVISVAPGEYEEDPFSVPSWVAIVGEGGFASVRVAATTMNANFISMNAATELWNVTLDGPTDAGYAAIFMEDDGYFPAVLMNVSIQSAYYGVHLNPPSALGMVHMHNVVNLSPGSGAISQMFRVGGYGSMACLASGCMTGPSDAVGIGWYVDGANAKAVLDNCFFRIADATALYMNTGADVRMNGCVISQADVAVQIGPDGSCNLLMTGQSFIPTGVGTDIICESATATIFLSGAASSSKMSIAEGAAFTGMFTDLTDGHVHVEGDIVGRLGADPVSLGDVLNYNVSTGLHTGGLVEEVAGVGNELKLDVASGHGLINAEGYMQEIAWDATQLTLPAAAGLYYIYVDGDGVVTYDTVEPGYGDNIILAIAGQDGSNITSMFRHRIPTAQALPRLWEYIEEVIGPICSFGCVATVNGVDGEKLDVDAGGFFPNLDETLITGASPITFNYHYRDGAGGWSIDSDTDTFDAAYYDDNSGTPAAVPAGKYHRQIVYVNVKPDGTDLYHVFYAQEYFDTQQEAEAAENPNPGSLPCGKYAMRVAAVIMQQGVTDIVSVVDQRPFIGQSASGITSFTDHGSLSGLADDDHTQYYNQTRGDARYAQLANGVTNGDSHDHAGGDGAQIAHSNLSGVGSNTHAQIDSHIGAASPHSGHSVVGHTHDHGNELSGLNDDDHPQYHNDTRGDARYPLLTNVPWRTVKKTADQTKNSDTTLAADSALQISLAANTKYAIRGRIFYDTSVAGDFKWRHAGPASPTQVRVRRSAVLPGGSTNTTIAVDTAYSSADIVLATNSDVGGWIEFDAIIHNGANAGTFSFQWAQNAADAGNTTVRAGSYLEYMTI